MKKRLPLLLFPVLALILEALPYGAVLQFARPAAAPLRELYSYFDLTPFGYANFAPLFTALGTCVLLVLLALSFSSVLHTVLCSILYLAVLVFFLLTALGVLRTRIFLILLAGLPLLVHIIMDLSDYEGFFLFLPELSVLLLMASLLCLALRLRPAGRREKT